jgi:hypothetical protein
MPEDVYGGRVPSDVVIYPYLVSLHVQFILDNALRAEAEGYDVFAIGSVQDPGIEEARSLVDIPVVGYGEAAMHFACLLGSRFAVVAFGAGFDQMLDLRVKRLGLSERALPTALMDARMDASIRARTPTSATREPRDDSGARADRCSPAVAAARSLTTPVQTPAGRARPFRRRRSG